MTIESKYYLVKKRAVPEVLVKVLEVKRLLDLDKNLRITEAVQRCGLSRSSYYKYKDDILPFYDDLKGKTLTIAMQMLDKPGLLSELLHLVADFNANILTIHQSIPVNGVASISLSVEVLEETGNIDNMIRDIEDCSGIYDVKILARK
ncbi:hypothetical protein HMPREF9333_01419 [Johnsonella ignava ATCC 51276]|jgi:UPF0735 ACT domain-containing protein CLOSTHATH_03959|uniref:UPF0735 ACT domain-containing protein HMPREF9333_01419 n=1 Tax=Johnsonella ignava ATCC 51276 TaxID=679200 RepID=G5GIM9_9FIRM|nr:ACT domain-containing protein [Johnsonella ignava]EHI55283.1 hypothetical protein HMPREF9333_01419 [Johnsonella ignava ATCC 51276]